jgi:MerR family transcriptional regulator, thiopeptide resistance regulator
MFTVKQIAHMAGITPRTLHYYDQIGLLKPSRVGENGYRYYGEEAMLRLQQILLYRELELPLDEIKTIMVSREFDTLGALENHREELRKRIHQMERLIKTVDKTILHLKGKHSMSEKQFFEGFSEEQQAEYEKEAMQMYDPETVRASKARWRSYSAAEKQRIGEEGNAAYAALLESMPKGPGSPEAQAGVELWRKHMEYFWVPNDEQLLGLTELYNEDPRFKKNYDRIDPQLADFIREAVKIYVENRKRAG